MVDDNNESFGVVNAELIFLDIRSCLVLRPQLSATMTGFKRHACQIRLEWSAEDNDVSHSENDMQSVFMLSKESLGFHILFAFVVQRISLSIFSI